MSFNPDLCRNESEVESKLIVQYLLPALGYSPDRWYQEVAYKNVRFDFLAFEKQENPFKINRNSPVTVVIEAKHPRENLDNHVRKLRRYLEVLSVRYGLLTNGKEIRIYAREKDNMVLLFRCSGVEVEDRIEQMRALIGLDNLRKIFVSNIAEEMIENLRESESKNYEPAIAIARKGTRAVSEEIDEFTSFISREGWGKIEGDREVSKSVNLITKEITSNMKTIAVYHNKGGVGKTTTVIHLAAAFRKKGKRVLIIDMDSQANTTFATGLVNFFDEESDTIKDSNIYHILRSKEFYQITDVVRKSQFTDPEIDVIPAHISLMNEEVALNNIAYIKGMLGKKLDRVQDSYDIVLIDTPPSLNLYPRTALITADYLLIPSDLKPFANQGLTNVKELFEDANEFRTMMLHKPPLEVLGVVACNISPNAKFGKYTLPKRIENIQKKYGVNVLDSIIFNSEYLAKCMEKTKIVDDIEILDPKSIFDYKIDSKPCEDFEKLAQEIGNKIGVVI